MTDIERLEQAYLLLLQCQWGGPTRIAIQPLLAMVRDLIAAHRGQSSEAVQNHFEALARG